MSKLGESMTVIEALGFCKGAESVMEGKEKEAKTVGALHLTDGSNYEKLETVGEGTYGKVLKCKNKTTGELVAIKILRVDADGFPPSALREIALLRRLRHPNIVRMFGVLGNAKEVKLVFEYVEQDLLQIIHESKAKIPPKQIKRFMCDLLQGLSFCHLKDVLHRDLKPANLLVNASGQLKLADFGLSRSINIAATPLTTDMVTIFYRGPELLLGDKTYSKPADMWSVGCIFGELFHGSPLFTGITEHAQLLKIFKTMGTPTDDIWSWCTELPSFKARNYPKFAVRSVPKFVDNVRNDEQAVDLLSVDPTLLDLCHYADLQCVFPENAYIRSCQAYHCG